VRLLDRLFDFAEIRVHSRRKESRDAFGAKLERDLGKTITVTDDWESCIRGADIVVEASRLEQPTPLLRTEWIKRSALVMPYGTMSAVELSLTDIMDKLVVDDGASARAARSARCAPMSTPASSPRRRSTPSSARFVAGGKPGRTSEDETILFWHRGPQPLRHRARPCHAGEGGADGARPEPALSPEVESPFSRVAARQAEHKIWMPRL